MASDGRSFVGGYFAMKLDDVNCGIVQKFEGGDIEADIVKVPMAHDYYVMKHLGGLKYKEFTVQMGLSMAEPVRKWINASLSSEFLRKNGELQIADFKRDIRAVREFSQALLTEMTFPSCDAGSKDPAFLTLKFTPEFTRNRKGSGKIESPAVASNQKLFLPSNFRLIVDGEDDSKVGHIEALTIKQTSTTDDIGESARDMELEPGKVEFPNLKVSMSEAHAETWYEWHEDFVVKGHNDESQHRQGALQYLDPTRAKTLLELTFHNLGIYKIAADASENNNDKIRHVTIEMYMENLVPKFGA